MVATSDRSQQEGVSLVEAAGAVLRYRGTVIAIGILLAAVVVVATVLRPRTYTAGASFTPQASRSPAGAFGGLAAQLGVVVPGNDNQSPAFYADLLRTRTILDVLVDMPVAFEWQGEQVRGTFTSLTLPDGGTRIQRQAAAAQALSKAMDVNVAPRTGVVGVEVTTRYPQLSVLLADSALGRLNAFNVETRRSQAAAQRQFLEGRLQAVGGELQRAEDAVREFNQRNRGDLRNAPDLQIQRERLERTVTLRSDVYRDLAQALEQAKLDEIRDTPLITVIQSARMPLGPDPRGLVFSAIIALIVGLVLGTVVALLRYGLEVSRHSHPEGFAALSAEMSAAKRDLRRLMFRGPRATPAGSKDGVGSARRD